jgi:hypothetical protein
VLAPGDDATEVDICDLTTGDRGIGMAVPVEPIAWYRDSRSALKEGETARLFDAVG